MKKSLRVIILAITVMLGLTACSSINNDSDTIELRLGHDNSVQSPGHRAFLEFEKMVEQRTNGRIDVQIFPAEQLGSIQDMFEKARIGDIQMSVGSTTVYAHTIPEFTVWDLFYLFDDEEHARRVLDGQAGKELMKPLERMNLEGLGYMEMGFRCLSNNKREVEKVEDIKGLKLRGYNPLMIKAWEALGANLNTLSWSEVFTSLQQNLIDGQECAVQSFYDNKFYEAQKYLSLTNHIYTNWLWYGNKDFMNSLSKEDRAIIDECVKETIDIQRELLDEDVKSALDKIEKSGVKVNEVDKEEREKMGQIMNDEIKQYIINECGQENYDIVMDAVEKERKVDQKEMEDNS